MDSRNFDLNDLLDAVRQFDNEARNLSNENRALHFQSSLKKINDEQLANCFKDVESKESHEILLRNLAEIIFRYLQSHDPNLVANLRKHLSSKWLQKHVPDMQSLLALVRWDTVEENLVYKIGLQNIILDILGPDHLIKIINSGQPPKKEVLDTVPAALFYEKLVEDIGEAEAVKLFYLTQLLEVLTPDNAEILLKKIGQQYLASLTDPNVLKKVLNLSHLSYKVLAGYMINNLSDPMLLIKDGGFDNFFQIFSAIDDKDKLVFLKRLSSNDPHKLASSLNIPQENFYTTFCKLLTTCKNSRPCQEFLLIAYRDQIKQNFDTGTGSYTLFLERFIECLNEPKLFPLDILDYNKLKLPKFKYTKELGLVESKVFPGPKSTDLQKQKKINFFSDKPDVQTLPADPQAMVFSYLTHKEIGKLVQTSKDSRNMIGQYHQDIIQNYPDSDEAATIRGLAILNKAELKDDDLQRELVNYPEALIAFGRNPPILTIPQLIQLNKDTDGNASYYIGWILQESCLNALKDQIITMSQLGKLIKLAGLHSNHTNYLLNFILSDNGIIALKEKLITIDQITSLIESAHVQNARQFLELFFSNNGIVALKERFINVNTYIDNNRHNYQEDIRNPELSLTDEAIEARRSARNNARGNPNP